MKAETVYHISDIHIKYNMKDDVRSDIIYAVDQLIEKISAEPEPVTVVVTGDIYDIANKINPEELLTFHLVFNKLNSCDKVKHIITIPGNHDYLVNPENNIIFASLVASKYDKLHHYNTNDILELDNVQYHVIANPKTFVAVPMPEDKTNVLLLHETIKGAVIDSNYSYSGEGRSASDFSNYHAVMLGDIHKQQSIELPTIAYAGSLIQRNFGEDLEHGALRWTLNRDKSYYEFIKFKLRRAYITLRASNNKVTNPPINQELYDKVKKVRFIHDNCTPAFIEKAIKNITGKYGRLDYMTDNTPAFVNAVESKGELVIMNSDSIIAEYLQKNYPNNPTRSEIANNLPSKNEIMRQKILKMHNSFIEVMKGNGKYKLLTLAWSNVFCYGENNFIDFTKLNGIVSIIGKNGVGKSSIIGILFYVLYDEKFGCNEILNTACTDYSITCTLSIMGDTYKIVKSNAGKGKTTALDIYKNNKLLKYGNIPDKNRALREIIGNHTNLSRNNIARQVHEMYLDKSQNSFYEELVNHLDLSEYIQIPNKIKDLVKPIKAKIAELSTKIKDNTKNSSDLELQLPKLESKLLELQNISDVLRAEKDEINRKYVRISGNYESSHQCLDCDPVDIETIDTQQKQISGLYKGDYLTTDLSVDECKAKITELSEDINKYTLSISKLTNTLMNHQNAVSTFSSVKPTISKDVVAAERDKIDSLMPSQIAEFRQKVVDLRKRIKENQETVKKLQATLKPDSGRLTDIPEPELTTKIQELEKNDKYKFSGKCECCIHNMKIVGADIETIKNLYNDITYFNNIRIHEQITAVDVSDTEYKELTHIIGLYDSNEYYNYEQITARINKIKSEISVHESNLLELNVSLSKHKKYLVYAQNAETIKAQKELADKVCCYNNQITKLVKDIDRKIVAANNECKKQEEVIARLRSEIQAIKKYENYREKKYELEMELLVYKEYENFVNIKTGIPALLVRNYIPILEQNINNILEKIVDFKITIDPDTHKITNAQNGVLAVQFSGSQKFITDIVIRLCLINNHPSTPNFMIIDEGFGSLDSESLVDMCGFMEKISNYVNLDFMIIISHIEDLNQIAKTRLVIECEDGYSRITYT